MIYMKKATKLWRMNLKNWIGFLWQQKNPPANTGDESSILWSWKIPHAIEQRSPSRTNTEPEL